MGKQFFVEWATWEKLVFVSAHEHLRIHTNANFPRQCLAAAIVLTVGAAAIKLAHTRWRLRKYGAVTASQKRSQAVQRQMSHKSAHSLAHDGDRVPFGIRAIERGIEVEGVYVSRGHTPDLDSQPSLAESSTWAHVSRRPQEVDLERQDVQPHLHETSSHLATTIPTVPGRVVYPPQGSSSAQISPTWSGDFAKASSPGNMTAISKPPGSRRSRVWHKRLGSASYVPRHNLSLTSTFEDLEATNDESTQTHQEDKSASSRSSRGLSDDSGQDGGSITASAPILFPARSTSSSNEMTAAAASEFGLLNSHRVSQAAETGQLAPRSRSRRPSLSGSILSLNTSSSALARYLDTCARSPSATTSPTSPTFDAVPTSLRRSSASDIQSFDQFCQSAPRPGSIDSRCISPVSEMESTSFSPRSRSQVSGRTSAAVSQLSLPLAESDETAKSGRRSFERIPSQVIRGHGSGFEVLSPGSLAGSQGWGARRSQGPPIALHNASARRARSQSIERHAKPHKERYSGLELSNSRRIRGGGV
nr:hypothetical protein CFP56_64604 [Quercus suber]